MENPYSPTDSSEPIELRDDFQWSPEQYPRIGLLGRSLGDPNLFNT
jgi:hypothetical protein